MGRSIAFWEALIKTVACVDIQRGGCGSPKTRPQRYLCRSLKMAFPRNLYRSTIPWEIPHLLPYADSPLPHKQTLLFWGGNNSVEESLVRLWRPWVSTWCDLDITGREESQLCVFKTKISFLPCRRKVKIFSRCMQSLGLCLTYNIF